VRLPILERVDSIYEITGGNMNDLINQLISVVSIDTLKVVGILTGVLAVLIEISKMCPLTKSTWDDTIVAKAITEITEWIDVLKNASQSIVSFLSRIAKK